MDQIGNARRECFRQIDFCRASSPSSLEKSEYVINTDVADVYIGRAKHDDSVRAVRFVFFFVKKRTALHERKCSARVLNVHIGQAGRSPFLSPLHRRQRRLSHPCACVPRCQNEPLHLFLCGNVNVFRKIASIHLRPRTLMHLLTLRCGCVGQRTTGQVARRDG